MCNVVHISATAAPRASFFHSFISLKHRKLTTRQRNTKEQKG